MKIKNFQRYILSKAFCHFTNVGMRTSVFREEAFADHKVKEYQNILLDYWRSYKPDMTISKS